MGQRRKEARVENLKPNTCGKLLCWFLSPALLSTSLLHSSLNNLTHTTLFSLFTSHTLSLSFSLSTMDSTCPETPISDLSKAMDILLKGHKVATQLQTTFNTHTHVTDDQSSMVDQILSSFSGSIALLSRVSDVPDEVSQLPGSTHVGSPDSGESIKTSVTLKEKRGCYKRRRTADSWSKDSADLVDDGHQWRKYGQKTILNAKFPRNYFRCTHKFDQLCPATKQVQRISEDPTVYRTTYYAQHTCKNVLKASQFAIDTTTDPSESSHFISFTTTANNSPCKQESSSLFQSFFQSSSTVKKECSSKNECDDGRLTSHNDQSLSSDYFLSNELSHAFDYGDVISSCTNTTTSASTHDDLDVYIACDFDRDVLNDFSYE